jgi:hypothetical protein
MTDCPGPAVAGKAKTVASDWSGCASALSYYAWDINEVRRTRRSGRTFWCRGSGTTCAHGFCWDEVFRWRDDLLLYF